jgi:hypothetical protein
MSIQTKRELEATREKLDALEKYYESTRRKVGLNRQAREDILRSTKQMINQLKEEIARAEARLTTSAERE